MKNKNIILGVAVSFAMGVFVVSCNKAADSLVVDTDTSSASDNANADNAFSGIFKSVSETADTSSSLRAGCPMVTISGITFPKTVTIDYGTVGCNDKKGKITAVLSAPFRTAGSVCTITTDNFYVGLNKIEAAKHTITNDGVSSGHQSFSVVVEDAVITGPAGVAKWNTTRSLQWVKGDTTPLIPVDDVYLISGQASGTNVKGVTYTATISTPLKVAVACKWIEEGVISITPAGGTARVIDFGTTGCDDQATVTVGSVVKPITM